MLNRYLKKIDLLMHCLLIMDYSSIQGWPPLPVKMGLFHLTR